MKNQPFRLDLQLFAEDPQPKPEDKPEEKEVPNFDEVMNVKKNFVPKDKYDRLEAEYKKAVSAVINGESNPEPKAPVKEPTVQDLTDVLFGPNRKEGMTNMEAVSNLLKLREEMMKEGAADPFVPHGVKIEAKNTPADYQRGENIASVLQWCLDEAEGDPISFNNLLRRVGVK